jgi:hypothetical protein
MYMPSVVRLLFATFLTFGCALSSHAVGLGLAKGTAWIGRPLDIGVQLRLDTEEDPASMCLAVDVVYGDAPVNRGQVRLIVDPGDSPDEALLRIQSAVPVDEPVVSLDLKVGCSQPLSRRYVFLSEVPVESRVGSKGSGLPDTGLVRPLERPQDSAIRPKAASSSTDRRVGSDRRAAKSVATPIKGARADGVPARRSSVPSAETRPAPTRSVVRKTENESQVSKPRLKLEPADLMLERDPVLRASPALVTEPQDGGTQRVEAAARWRAINSGPEDILKDGQRLLALQADVSLLKEQRQKDQAEIAELRNRLQLAESARFGWAWFLGIAVALIAALSAAFHFWHRSRARSQPHWWNPAAETATHESSPSTVQEVNAIRSSGTDLATTGADKDGSIQVVTVAAAPEPSRPVTRPMHASLESVDFQNSLSGAARAVRVEELLDIQQQADFFISLGQYDQAVATLRNHIADNVETSVLAYLDLLKIYHLQGRAKDYELVRHEFNELFNAEVPELAAFRQQTRGLEAYQSILSRISALWASPAVLDFIEQSLFRKPGQGSQVLDLEAYRELLMLYSVAKDLVLDGRTGQIQVAPNLPPVALPDHLVQAREKRQRRPSGLLAPETQPVAIGVLSERDQLESGGSPLMRVPPSPNLGLDIDLSELVPARPEVTSPQTKPNVTDVKAPDSHLIDFDLFDLATKAHADSKRGKS